MTDLLKLLVGFLLTTVFGGSLGHYFQNRAWRHQFRVRLLEAELASATRLFEDLSRLMDKRLYRMRQVHWKLKQPVLGEILEVHMERYREVLYEWNDALNRNLALTETYFGLDIKKTLEGTIYEEFRRIGEVLESEYRKLSGGGPLYDSQKTAADLTRLRDSIYRINVHMIRTIQQRQQGLSQVGQESNRASIGVALNAGLPADT